MMINLEVLCAILSVACIGITLICFLFDMNRNCIPTLIAISGGVLYVIFLNMSGLSAQQSYLFLILAYILDAGIAFGDYMQAKYKNKKYQKFMQATN